MEKMIRTLATAWLYQKVFNRPMPMQVLQPVKEEELTLAQTLASLTAHGLIEFPRFEPVVELTKSGLALGKAMFDLYNDCAGQEDELKQIFGEDIPDFLKGDR